MRTFLKELNGILPGVNDNDITPKDVRVEYIGWHSLSQSERKNLKRLALTSIFLLPFLVHNGRMLGGYVKEVSYDGKRLWSSRVRQFRFPISQLPLKEK